MTDPHFIAGLICGFAIATIMWMALDQFDPPSRKKLRIA